IKGSTLYFGIIPDFYFLKNSDFEQFILVNRRKGPLQVTVEPVPTPGIAEIFTDGSYMDTTKRSGSACIIRTSDGHEEILMTKTSHAGNNLAELFAVIEGVRFLKNDNHIRINTDSRYVIKGLAQWIHYWKINNWLTANCNPVKNIDYWKELDVLTQGKTVELHWIKGHSFHFENSFCDRAAREAALTNPAFAVKNLPVS
ncbi:MAG: ribonuclease H family protein, partial [Bacteroidota bacterium]